MRRLLAVPRVVDLGAAAGLVSPAQSDQYPSRSWFWYVRVQFATASTASPFVENSTGLSNVVRLRTSHGASTSEHVATHAPASASRRVPLVSRRRSVIGSARITISR